MGSHVRVRLAVLLCLAALGVGLAGVGAAVGVTEPIGAGGTSGEFVVAGDSVTFSDGAGNVTVVENTANVTAIRVEETAPGRFTVETEAERPLSAAERDRAVEIARSNATVRAKLDRLDGYELGVDPVYRVTADRMRSYNVTIDADGVTNGSGNQTYVFTGNVSAEDRDDAVVVERDPSYVEDRAVVRVRQPSADERRDLRYSVDVDLANGTVTGITDWAAIREDSTVEVSANATATTAESSN
ncbi:hypothetical protein [Halostella salina]|uniref:hypothetical protein n=1 Tax=Halostella salina TaxID=1547897 RepID=UPI000EF7DD5E|nr:hypothetical protein [Halostella salina]